MMIRTIDFLHDVLDRAVADHPGSVAITSQGRQRTYRELFTASVAVARLLAESGVRRGDRILVKDADGFVVANLVYAASRLGASFSVLHEQVRGEPLVHVLGDCEPKLLVSDDEDASRTAESQGVRVLGSCELARASEVAMKESPPDVAALENPGLTVDPACLIYTSGTTALPKAVVSTHQQMLFAATAIQESLRYRSDDVIYCPLPLSFDYGLYQLFLAALSGAHLWLGSTAEAGPPLLRHLRESEATILPAVPSVAGRLAWLLRRSKDKPERLRLITNTGAALGDSTIASLRKALPGLRVQVMYGLTECKRTAIMPPDGDIERPGSCGIPLRGTEVFVIDDDGRRLPPGELGQFVVRGPNVMAGYWRRPELTTERFHRADGLFPELRTGDYGWVDADGYLYFSGRRDDLYKERGFRVSATEVESAAQRVDGVKSAVVIPPDSTRKSLLAVDSECPGNVVLERMRAYIEEFKIPPRCVRLRELPVNANGKFDRPEIAKLVEDVANAPVKESRQ